MMILYVLIILSALLLYKEVKNNRKRKKIAFVYSVVMGIALLYNLGQFIGKQIYLSGF